MVMTGISRNITNVLSIMKTSIWTISVIEMFGFFPNNDVSIFLGFSTLSNVS